MKTVVSTLLALSVLAGIAAAATYGWSAPSDFTVNGSTHK
jgi:hypothetical protein